MSNIQKLGQEFFSRPTQKVAPDLIGKLLIHQSPEGTTIGRIVETESYHQDDPAAHSFRGRTERNKSLFGPPGTAYVYLSYGIHYCFNTATYKEGHGEGVLIRALEPIAGIEVMQKRRGLTKLTQLCSGPAKLTQASGILPSHDGSSLFSPPLYLAEDELSKSIQPEMIIITPRIGISKAVDEPLRFCLAGNEYLSRKI